MKRIFIVFGILAVFLAGFVVLKDQIIRSVVTTVAAKVTGTRVEINGFSLSVLSSTINITGFKMYNPSGFPEGLLVSCPKIKVIYDRATLFKPDRRFLVVDIELQELGLTRNQDGKLNVDALKIAHPSTASSSAPMRIDLLNLKIGQIVYKDYKGGAAPVVRVYQVNRSKSFKKIPTAQQLAVLVLAEPMKAIAIKNAEIYGAAMLTGAAILPVAVAATLIGKDNVRQIIDASFERVYAASLTTAKSMGRITKNDAQSGVIKASIQGAMVAFILRKSSDNRTEITISARKYMLPKLDIAGGVLYQVLDQFR